MAASGAFTNTKHRAKSGQRPETASFGAPLSLVTRPPNPISPPTQTAPSPIDHRWKRGRPVTFSSHAFSTQPSRSTAQAGATTCTPTTCGAAVQAHEQEVDTTPSQSCQQYEQYGSTVTAAQQRPSTTLLPHTAQHTKRECIVDDSPSSGTRSPVSTAESLSVNTQIPVLNDQRGTPFVAADSPAMSSLEGDVNESVSEIDSMLTPFDESESRPEQDGLEVEEADEESREAHTALEFQIPEDVLRAAMTAPENTKASFWSSTLYRGPEDRQILVHYCKTKEVAERVAKHFVNETVVGFDIEWKPYASADSIKKNVSLVQLACEDRIALFHIAIFQGKTAEQLMPPTLKAILESPDIYKCGVAVKGDFSRIVKFLNVQPQGIFELSRLHNLVEHFATNPDKVNKKLVGLAPQVQQHLQLPLYKGGQLVDDPEDLSNVRSSDWSLPLNLHQIHYAAADAYASFRLFDVLEEKRKQLKPTPPRPLVCDYDSKPKPRSSVNKPRKKRASVPKDKGAADTFVGESVAAAGESDQSEQFGKSDEEAEEAEEVEKIQQHSQDTEGYTTAQEDLLDSHQLEGEDSTCPEECSESTENSEEDGSTRPEPSLKNENAAVTDASQRRVGRVNLSMLRGPDPDYPILPKFRGSDVCATSSDEDLIDISDRPNLETFSACNKVTATIEQGEETNGFNDPMPDKLNDTRTDTLDESETRKPDVSEIEKLDHSKIEVFQDSRTEVVQDSEANQSDHSETDEFDDSELEEVLQDLTIDDDGILHSTSSPTAARNQSDCSEQTIPVPTVTTSELETACDESFKEASPIPEDLVQPALQSTPQTDPPHTPKYTLATTWARAYLSSTIPSPGCPAPSHIRATVAHLRAYHMWAHQQMGLSEIAVQLRDPPLPESTVRSYVLQAITLERMEYEVEAVRELLMGMPAALRKGKWRVLAEKVGAK